VAILIIREKKEREVNGGWGRTGAKKDRERERERDRGPERGQAKSLMKYETFY